MSAPETKKCPFCGAELPAEARFCLRCMESFDEKRTVKKPEKRKSRPALVIAAAVLLLSAALVCALALSGAFGQAQPDSEGTELHGGGQQTGSPSSGDDRRTDGDTDVTETDSGHTHEWVQKTKTLHHEEQGHYGQVEVGTNTVVDKQAYDEKVVDQPKYYLCDCGRTWEYSTQYPSGVSDELLTHCWLDSCNYTLIPETYKTVHHDAVTHEEPVYETRWIVDVQAYDEEVPDGYYCSICGAERS